MSWWQARNAREKLLLGLGGIVVLALMYYSLVVEPLRDGITQKQQQVENELQLAAWLLAVAPEVQKMRRAPGENSAQNNGSLLSIVDKTSKAAGLGKSVSRLQPEGDAEVRAWLESAPFNETLRWLRTLESSYGVEINELSFNRNNEAGLIKARLIFKRPK